MSSAADLLSQAQKALDSAKAVGAGRSLRGIRISLAISRLYEAQGRSVGNDVLLRKCNESLITAMCQKLAFFTEQSRLTTPDVLDIRTTIDHAISILSTSPAQALSFTSIVDDLVPTLTTTPTGLVLLHKLSLPSFTPTNVRDTVIQDGFDHVRLNAVLTLAEAKYTDATRMYESNAWARALNLLQSEDAALNSALELEYHVGNKGYMEHGGATRGMFLRADYDLLLAQCRGHQAVKTGDDLFETSLRVAPEELLGWAQLAQDDYRVAYRLSATRDIELEGMSLGRLARFHERVTLVPSTAHELYLRAVQLGASLSPNLPKGEWYSTAVKAVQAYRDSLHSKEAKEWADKRKPVLDKLQKEVNQLETNARTMEHREFVDWVWVRWPPKTPGSPDVPKDTDKPKELTKKMMLKIIQRYHSDKNGSWGEEWHVLSEEITKMLTQIYERMKGVD